MGNKFKVGDKVRCVDAYSVLRRDKVYIVKDTQDEGFGERYLYLEGVTGGWFYERFEKAEKELPVPFKAGDKVVCIAPGQNPGLTEGEVYTVSQTKRSESSGGVMIQLEETGRVAAFFPRRFRADPLAAAPSKGRYIVSAHDPDREQSLLWTLPGIYDDRKQAELEARQYASWNPDYTYGVSVVAPVVLYEAKVQTLVNVTAVTS